MEIHQASIKELEDGLAPELVEELERLSLPVRRRDAERGRAADRPGPAGRLARGPVPRHPDRDLRPADGRPRAARADAPRAAAGDVAEAMGQDGPRPPGQDGPGTPVSRAAPPAACTSDASQERTSGAQERTATHAPLGAQEVTLGEGAGAGSRRRVAAAAGSDAAATTSTAAPVRPTIEPRPHQGRPSRLAPPSLGPPAPSGRSRRGSRSEPGDRSPPAPSPTAPRRVRRRPRPARPAGR